MAQNLRETDEPGGLSTFLRAARWRWRVVLAIVVPAGLLGMGYVASLPPTATAVSVVSLVPEDPDVAFSDLISITTSRYAVAMTSTPRLEQVAEATGVGIDELQGAVSVDVNPDDANMRVTATLETPAEARAVADAVADGAVRAGGGNELLTVEKIAPAALQPSPVTSSPTLLGLVLLLAALALGLWAAYVLERLRPRVVDEADAERVTGVPTLGLVTQGSEDSDLVALAGSESAAVQGRTLRAGLRASEGGRPSALTITGVGAGRGVATTAYLLSSSLVTVGSHVLLVDGDTEHRVLSEQLGEDGSGSLDELDAGAAAPRPAGHRGELALVTAGSGPYSDEDALSRSLGRLVDRAGEQWDRVVVSTASMDGSGVAESALTATTQAVLVIPRGTETSAVLEAARRVRRLNGGLVGTVVYRGSASP